MPNKIISNGKTYSATYPTDLAENVVSFESADESNPTSFQEMPPFTAPGRMKTLMHNLSIAYKNLRYIMATKSDDKNIFSFDEVRIGTWIDEKPLYRKMIDFGELPGNARKDVPINIENAKHVHINIGKSFWVTRSNNESNGTSDTFVYADYIKSIGMGTGIIVIITNNENANKYKAYVCLEYTKTTD